MFIKDVRTESHVLSGHVVSSNKETYPDNSSIITILLNTGYEVVLLEQDVVDMGDALEGKSASSR